jgi:hypothetical protein
MTVTLGGANNPQLTKIIASQKTIMTSMGLETEVAPCSNIKKRVCPRFKVIAEACDLSDRCESFCGTRF